MRTISYELQNPDSVVECRERLISQIRAAEKDPSDTDNPITTTIDLKALRQSDNPLAKTLEEILRRLEQIEGRLAAQLLTLDALTNYVPVLPYIAGLTSHTAPELKELIARVTKLYYATQATKSAGLAESEATLQVAKSARTAATRGRRRFAGTEERVSLRLELPNGCDVDFVLPLSFRQFLDDVLKRSLTSIEDINALFLCALMQSFAD